MCVPRGGGGGGGRGHPLQTGGCAQRDASPESAGCVCCSLMQQREPSPSCMQHQSNEQHQHVARGMRKQQHRQEQQHQSLYGTLFAFLQ